jgi:hypothetical protein
MTNKYGHHTKTNFLIAGNAFFGILCYDDTNNKPPKLKEVFPMKKRLALALALAMMLTLAACGSTETPAANTGNNAPAPSAATAKDEPDTVAQPEVTEPETVAEPKTLEPDTTAQTQGIEGDAMASLISWMKSGTYSYDFTMTSESADGTITATGSIAVDGGKVSTTQETTYDGQTVTSRTILKDDKTYIIDDANKMIIIMSGINEEMTGEIMTDYTGITKTGEGEGEIDGKTLPYEDYTVEGYVVRYFLDGGEVYGMETDAEGFKTVMIITNAKSSVPADAFDLPEGYMEMAM